MARRSQFCAIADRDSGSPFRPNFAESFTIVGSWQMTAQIPLHLCRNDARAMLALRIGRVWVFDVDNMAATLVARLELFHQLKEP
jgi:hypothetical protein